MGGVWFSVGGLHFKVEGTPHREGIGFDGGQGGGGGGGGEVKNDDRKPDGKPCLQSWCATKIGIYIFYTGNKYETKQFTIIT